MQQINANVSLSGSGSATLLDGWRDVQAALRALQRLNGQTGGTGSESQIARPVLAVPGTERGKILSSTPPEVALPLLADRDVPTGPRPTFERTPLEKMRTDVMDPATQNRRMSMETNPTLALGRWDAALSTGASSGANDPIRRVEKTDTRLDVRT